jgi:hypothetical protein
MFVLLSSTNIVLLYVSPDVAQRCVCEQILVMMLHVSVRDSMEIPASIHDGMSRWKRAQESVGPDKFLSEQSLFF